jgi:hypothetical protein
MENTQQTEMETKNPLERWCCLLDAKQRPLTSQEMELLLVLVIANQEELTKMEKEVGNSLAGKILSTRMPVSLFKERIEDRLKIWIAAVCRTPGEAVMWAYTLCVMAKELSPAQVTFADWCEKYFPAGLPDQESMRKIWDYQKGFTHGMKGVDNLIDNPELWPKYEHIVEPTPKTTAN